MFAEYEISIHASLAFLYINNEQPEKEIRRTIPFTIASKRILRGFPGGAVVESLPANAGDTGSRPGLGGSHMPRSN